MHNLHFHRTNGCPRCGAPLTGHDFNFEFFTFACGTWWNFLTKPQYVCEPAAPASATNPAARMV